MWHLNTGILNVTYQISSEITSMDKYVLVVAIAFPDDIGDNSLVYSHIYYILVLHI
jgi:hypothetical protein